MGTLVTTYPIPTPPPPLEGEGVATTFSLTECHETLTPFQLLEMVFEHHDGVVSLGTADESVYVVTGKKERQGGL